MKYSKLTELSRGILWSKWYTPETLKDKIQKHWWQSLLAVLCFKLTIITIALSVVTYGLLRVNTFMVQQTIEHQNLIEEQNLEIARMISLQNGSVNDIIEIAKVIQKIINTASGSDREFIEKTISAAIHMQTQKGIPASALMGQAIYESNYGKSTLATKGYNYFGIKALSNKWDGEVIWKVTQDDDKTVTHSQPFRKYKTPYDGFMGYYEFLHENSRYDHAWGRRNGVEFVREIARAGYCPDSDYVVSVNRIIMRHKLNLLEDLLKAQVKTDSPIKPLMDVKLNARNN